MPIYKIKSAIKKDFNLDYDFDLRYKGAKVLETSLLSDNCFDDSTPLVVSRKNAKHVSHEAFEEEYKKAAQVQNFSRQTPLTITINRILSLNELYEEEIEDETKSKVYKTSISNEGYHWKPTIIVIKPADPVHEEISFTLQTSTNNSLSSQLKPSSLNDSVDSMIDERSRSVLPMPFSSRVRPTYSTSLSMNADSTLTVEHRGRSPMKRQRNLKLSAEKASAVTTRNASTSKHILEKLDATEIKENPLNTGKIQRLFK